MKSPLHYTRIMNATIDLSQLTEVTDLVVSGVRHGQVYKPGLGFAIQYGSGHRHMIEVPGIELPNLDKESLYSWERNPTPEELAGEGLSAEFFERRNGSEMLICTDGSFLPWDQYRSATSARNRAYMETTRMAARIKKEHAELLAVWRRWKEVEPEVYSIIREKLGG